MGSAGCQVRLVGFSRSKYPESRESFEVVNLGSLDHGRYLQRVRAMFSNLRLIRSQIREFDVLHCFGLDSLVIGRLASIGLKKPVVYQVQDIRPVLIGDSIKARAIRVLERILLKKVINLVVSSDAFYTQHFRKHYDMRGISVSVIENKLEEDPLESFSTFGTHLGTSTFTIGYFGVLRCQRSWDILTRFVNEQSADRTYNLYVRGIPSGIVGFSEAVEKDQQVEDGGPYRDPDDLEQLYGQVDIVWASYPYGYGKPGNWRWARTVRFYEACAFGVPVIVQEGTRDAEFVQAYDVGLIIDMSDVEASIKALEEITPRQLSQWKRNILNLPRDYFIHSYEYTDLCERLQTRVESIESRTVR